MHFKVNLTLISILVIVLYFNIPFYNNWLNTNLLSPSFDIFALSKQTEVEQRKINRYGYSYAIYSEMGRIFKEAKMDSPVLLLPPDAFLKEQGVRDFATVEPAIYYYFTGMRGVWPNSPGVEKANAVIIPDGHGKVMLKRISGKDELNMILADLKKYKID